MSLVAYGSSGEESDEENSGEESVQATPLTDKPKGLSLPAPKVTSAEPKAETSSNTSMFACLPPPKHETPAVLTEETDLDDVPVVKAPSTVRQKVKISIPALADFKDDEDSAPQPKKPKPTPKGSGLLSILPEPKNISSRPSRPLVPHVLTKRPVPPKKPIKKPSEKPVLVKAQHDSGDESEDDDSAIDFFSLTGQEAPEPAEIKLEDLLPPQAGPSSRPPSATVRQEVAAPKQVEEVEEEEQQQHEDLKLDDEALRQLCGRRVQREELNLIDLHGDKMMPDPKEWMLKQMTQEQEMHGHRSSQPSSTHRRKHQITYLAFQAKEREIELKNQWAQNRMTKKQTQAKYGF